MFKGYPLTKEASMSRKEWIWSIGDPQPGVYASETDGTCNSGFSSLSAPVVRIDVTGSPRDAAARQMPRRLTSDCRQYEGVERLELDMIAAPGRYTLNLDVLETLVSDFCVVCLDGEEIGAFGIPVAGDSAGNRILRPSGDEAETGSASDKVQQDIRTRYGIESSYEQRSERLQPYRFEIPFIVSAEGLHTLALEARSFVHTEDQAVYVGDGFSLMGVSMASGFEEAVPSLLRPFPGQALFDAWGWMSMTSFDHPGRTETAPDRLIARAIREPYKWGANNFEFLPVHHDGVLFDFSEEDGWADEVGYVHSQSTSYTDDTIARIMGEAKSHGMLNTLFFYSLYGAGFIHGRMSPEQRARLADRLFERWMNSAAPGSRFFDAMIMEAWDPLDAPSLQQKAWRWNPGLTLFMSTGAAGAIPQTQDYGYSPGFHAYNAHWQGPLCYQTGFDHSYPLLPYPKEAYTTEWGTSYMYMQGCGQPFHPRRQFPLLRFAEHGITNRTAAPDWIVAQAHQFALGRWLAPGNRLASGVCWEADEETMAPEGTRHYVYAASQDPIRLAVAGQLTDTGTGGEIALKSSLKKRNKADRTRLRPRHRYPADTHFIQNNHLQALVFPDKEYNSLLCDVQRSATYYNTGTVLELAFPLCATRFEDNRYLEKHVTYPEQAGPKAVLREESVLGSEAMSLRQTREMTMYADVAGLRIELVRELLRGQGGSIDTVMSFRDYDTLTTAEGMTWAASTKLPQQTGAVRLSDSRNVYPDVIVAVHSATTLEEAIWHPGEGLVWRHRLDRRHRLEADIVVPDAVGRQYDDALSLALLQQAEQLAEAGSSELAVRNALPVPAAVIARLPARSDGPYMVQERGWWRMRGAAPSRKDGGEEWLKVYADAEESVRILPFGFIDGAVKPGWGCQHTLAFRDVTRHEHGVAATVHVDGATPLIFAPRVELAESCTRLKLDGREWHYREGALVYLPNRPGAYRLEAEIGDESDAPALSRTYALIETMEWDEGRGIFRFKAGHPLWTRKVVPGFKYSASITCGGRRIASITGGELADAASDRAILWFESGLIEIQFDS